MSVVMVGKMPLGMVSLAPLIRRIPLYQIQPGVDLIKHFWRKFTHFFVS
jgi:hypothetical protein